MISWRDASWGTKVNLIAMLLVLAGITAYILNMMLRNNATKAPPQPKENHNDDDDDAGKHKHDDKTDQRPDQRPK